MEQRNTGELNIIRSPALLPGYIHQKNHRVFASVTLNTDTDPLLFDGTLAGGPEIQGCRKHTAIVYSA